MGTGNTGLQGGKERTTTSEETIQKLKSFNRTIFPRFRVASSRLHFLLCWHIVFCQSCSFLFPDYLQNLQSLKYRDQQNRLKFSEHCSTQSESYRGYLSELDFLMNELFSSTVSSRCKNVGNLGVNRPDKQPLCL